MEDFQISESEEDSDESFNVYGADPVFSTQKELDEFMTSCNSKRVNKSVDQVELDEVFCEKQKTVKKNCSCNKCEDIWSGSFEHICCHQIKPR